MQEKGIIRIRRADQFVGCLNKYRVFIDGKFVGRIRVGGNEQYSVEAGRHTVFAKYSWDWSKSRKLILDIKPGQVIDLDCGSKNGWVFLTIPAVFPIVRYYYPGGFDPVNIYLLTVLLIMLYTGISLVPSFFLYLNRVKDDLESGVV